MPSWIGFLWSPTRCCYHKDRRSNHAFTSNTLVIMVSLLLLQIILSSSLVHSFHLMKIGRFQNSHSSSIRNSILHGVRVTHYNDEDYEYGSKKRISWKQKEGMYYYKNQNYDDDYYDNSDNDDREDSIYNSEFHQDWTWETFQSHTHILLPPSSYSANSKSNISYPSHIIHFVGGTVFGSYPLQFYKPMLEQVAKSSNAIIVATAVPVVLNENPLNHYKISKRILGRFWRAYKYVIVDEYGSEAVEAMKMIGLGHSLGARFILLMSSAFQQQQEKQQEQPQPQRETRRMEPRKKTKPIDYDACIFMAFNNYNALESIPGLDKLGQSIVQNSFTALEKKREQLFRQKQDELRQSRYKRNYEYDHDFNRDAYDYVQEGYEREKRVRDRERQKDSKKKNISTKTRSSNESKDRDYYYDDSDIGLGEVVSVVSVGITEGIQEMKTALTPDLDRSDLEFQPTPQDLWDRVKSGGFVEKTLLVQFDQDKIDQSSKLATIVMEYFKERQSVLGVDESNNNVIMTAQDSSLIEISQEDKNGDMRNTAVHEHPSLRLALLSGTHLTPVTYTDTFIMQAIKRTGVFDSILEEALQEATEYSRRSKRRREQVRNEDLKQLSKTISSFISNISFSGHSVHKKE